MAEALKETKGPRDREEELWIAWVSKVLPVPVAPRMSTGMSLCAASAASLRQRCMAALSEVSCAPLSRKSDDAFMAAGSPEAGAAARRHTRAACGGRR